MRSFLDSSCFLGARAFIASMNLHKRCMHRLKMTGCGRDAQKLWRPSPARGKRPSSAGQQAQGSFLDVGLLRQLKPLASLTPVALAAAATDSGLNASDRQVRASLQVPAFTASHVRAASAFLLDIPSTMCALLLEWILLPSCSRRRAT